MFDFLIGTEKVKRVSQGGKPLGKPQALDMGMQPEFETVDIELSEPKGAHIRVTRTGMSRVQIEVPSRRGIRVVGFEPSEEKNRRGKARSRTYTPSSHWPDGGYSEDTIFVGGVAVFTRPQRRAPAAEDC